MSVRQYGEVLIDEVQNHFEKHVERVAVRETRINEAGVEGYVEEKRIRLPSSVFYETTQDAALYWYEGAVRISFSRYPRPLAYVDIQLLVFFLYGEKREIGEGESRPLASNSP